MSDKKKEFVNPIDKDKITENPGTLPYAHTVGGVTIKPIDKGRVKGLAVSAMYEQTDMQMDQIRKQIELLAEQAKAIQDRVLISEMIYEAEISFKPLISHLYHLYQRSNQKYVLSMVGPEEWGGSSPYQFIASVRLLADHTWEIKEGDLNVS
jgi:sporulation protein YlmC with PRC-barrel domain